MNQYHHGLLFQSARLVAEEKRITRNCHCSTREQIHAQSQQQKHQQKV